MCPQRVWMVVGHVATHDREREALESEEGPAVEVEGRCAESDE